MAANSLLSATMQDFETLGAFYLGRPYDLATKTATPAPLMYDSRDLLTHAVCIGMTGSGKTGLCIGLLEEALIDGIPAIIIDPKGDLANLALTFPSLSGEAFAPWVNEDEAQRAGQDVPTFAAAQAERWRKGLASWGQDAARVKRLHDAAEVTIYTPGSSAGTPVSILKSFAVPPTAVLEDRDLLRERLQTTATSLLGLAGIEADPLQSREHILHRQAARDRLARGHRPGSGGADPADPVAADHAHRRPRTGRVLPGQGALRPGDGAEQPARGAGLRPVAHGRAARHRVVPAHARRTAARGGVLDRAPERRRADVLRVAAAQRDPRLGAHAVGHDEPARAALHGRNLRLPAAGGQPAVQGADAAAAEAGARLRPGRRARDAEPRRSGLQGAVQHRHLVHRAPADRARQGARARGPGGRQR